MVSGPKWGLGGGRRPWACGGGGGGGFWAEERVVSGGRAVSALVLWSGRPGTGPRSLGADCGLRSDWNRSVRSAFPLEVKVKTNCITMKTELYTHTVHVCSVFLGLQKNIRFE